MTSTIRKALEAEGYTVRQWAGGSETRYYLRDARGQDVGYVTDYDLTGSTGTCRQVTRRAGYVAAILRGVGRGGDGMTTQRECAICAMPGLVTEGVVEIDMRPGLEGLSDFACAECWREIEAQRVSPLTGEALRRLRAGATVVCDSCAGAGVYDPANEVAGGITLASDGHTLVCHDCPDVLPGEEAR